MQARMGLSSVHRRPRKYALLVVGVVVVAAVIGMSLSIVGARAAPTQQSTKQVILSSTTLSPSPSPASLPGDYLTLSCPHGGILAQTDFVCLDEESVHWFAAAGLPGGNYSHFQLTGVADDPPPATPNFVLSWVSTGDACLGGTLFESLCPHSSTIATPILWEYCASRCSGTVTLVVEYY